MPEAAALTAFKERNAVLADLLADLAGEEVFYMAVPGNAGDSLIAASTYQVFDELGVQIKLLESPQAVRNQTVLIAGSGNFVPYYNAVADALGKLRGKGNRVIILPSSIRGYAEILANL